MIGQIQCFKANLGGEKACKAPFPSSKKIFSHYLSTTSPLKAKENGEKKTNTYHSCQFGSYALMLKMVFLILPLFCQCYCVATNVHVCKTFYGIITSHNANCTILKENI